MVHEKPEFELARLRKEQFESLQDELYGCLSLAARAEYERKVERIQVLQGMVQTAALAEGSLQLVRAGQAEQRRQWNKDSEPDTAQSEARQCYRGRETDSANAFRESEEKRGVAKNKADKQDGEQ
jgi:hypothetical protein